MALGSPKHKALAKNGGEKKKKKPRAATGPRATLGLVAVQLDPLLRLGGCQLEYWLTLEGEHLFQSLAVKWIWISTTPR